MDAFRQFVTDLGLDPARVEQGLLSLLVALLAVAVGLIVHAALGHLLDRASRRAQGRALGEALRFDHWRAPLRALLPAMALLFVLPLVALPEGWNEIAGHALGLWIIGAVAWCAVGAVGAARDVVLREYRVDERDNLRARRVVTQFRVIERVLYLAIVLVAVSSGLMTFERVRDIGVSLLASAGVLGIVLGFAAQRSIGTLFAGVQIAITQPIRLDDVVIVEGEWGWIEEITLTYVVVRIWDQRRLVLPITYFIDHPFQNWTRTNAEILGTVYLYTDYTVDVGAVREELERIVRKAEDWDGRVCGLQVTNATDRALELRALVSAADSSKAWTLRCLVRERLVAYLQGRYPHSLPRVRLEAEGRAPGSEPSGASGTPQAGPSA